MHITIKILGYAVLGLFILLGIWLMFRIRMTDKGYHDLNIGDDKVRMIALMGDPYLVQRLLDSNGKEQCLMCYYQEYVVVGKTIQIQLIDGQISSKSKF